MGEESDIAQYIDQITENFTGYLQSILGSDWTAKLGEIALQVTSGVFSVVKILINIIVGFVVAVYVLFDKEKFVSQMKKIVCLLFKPRAVNAILETAKETHMIFTGFVVGKIVDSLIIGVLTFILMTIFKFPYIALISVVIGITNIIPFFGPFIGAIPCAFLVIINNPLQGLLFLVLILILQQIDGNIIGPHILGPATGLSSFWVVFAILLFGGLFGFVGMLIGVPLFASIYNILRKLINTNLKKKNLPIDLPSYVDVGGIDEDTKELFYVTPEEKASAKSKKVSEEEE